ncbi:MAG TPA: hypothetical protein VKS82_08230 [Streptosporangiaceae bacterium]|nr:hypothetical protein [Streptosporangiaceae bacterium]
MQVRVTGVAAGTSCQLWVSGSDGQQAVAGGWQVAPGQQTVWYPASAPFQAAQVRAFELTAGPHVLVTIPGRR